MIHIIFPIDPTTDFLSKITTEIEKYVSINLIEVHPSIDSYKTALLEIRKIPDGATVLFMGHGQDRILYGGGNIEFEKRVLIRRTELEIFRNKNLFALACSSSDLLKSTLSQSGIRNSIGFKDLPTEMDEVINNRRLMEAGINQEIINDYKNALVEVVSGAFLHNIKHEVVDFHGLYDYLRLLINRKINEAVLSHNKRQLADLLFKMKSEMASLLKFQNCQ